MINKKKLISHWLVWDISLVSSQQINSFDFLDKNIHKYLICYSFWQEYSEVFNLLFIFDKVKSFYLWNFLWSSTADGFPCYPWFNYDANIAFFPYKLSFIDRSLVLELYKYIKPDGKRICSLCGESARFYAVLISALLALFQCYSKVGLLDITNAWFNLWA